MDCGVSAIKYRLYFIQSAFNVNINLNNAIKPNFGYPVLKVLTRCPE